MPKTYPIQTNFTAGELSGRLLGRIDLDRYNNGAKAVENFVPLVEGGLRRRYGLKQLAQAKNNTETRLVRYVYSNTEAYVLEIGVGYIRVFNSDGQLVDGATAVEVATSYAADDLWQLEYVQIGDGLAVAHSNFPIQRLYRVSPTQWMIGNLPLDPAPFDEIGSRPATTATLSSAGNVGDVITITLAAGLFLLGDVGRNFVAGPGIAEISAVTSTTTATATVTSAFASTSLAENTWKLAGSPIVPICCLSASPAGAQQTLFAMGARITVSSMSLDDEALTINTAAAHGLAVNDHINLSFFDSADIDGNYYVASVDSDTAFKVSYTGSLLASANFGYIYKFNAGAAFTADDVGKFVRMNDGLLRIDGYTGNGQVTVSIIKELDAATTAEGSTWSLEASCWNDVDGYPACVANFQQRLIAGGTLSYPHGLWGSSTGTTTDYTIATDDDDAFLFSVDADEVSQLKHLVTANAMLGFSSSAEFAISDSSTGKIGPTDAPDCRTPSTYGSTDVRPLRVGGEIMFAQRAGTKVRAVRYDYASDSYVSTDLCALAQQISSSGIVDSAYQQESTPVMWFVRTDGVLISCTYDVEQRVTAWARHTTNGKFVSVACIPGGADDVDDIVMVAVDRVINGETVRFIERFDSDLQTDCAITGTVDVATAIWTGFDSLEGMSVDVKADGIYQGSFTVTNGTITLKRVASAIEVGLHYDSEVDLLPPAVNGALGTNIGSAQSTNRVIIRVEDTIGGQINGTDIPWREFGGDVLDQAPQPFSGDKDLSQLGWTEDETVIITQTQPYAMTLLSVIRSYTSNQG